MSRKTTKRFSLLVKTQLLEKFDRYLTLIRKNEKSSISRNKAIQAMMELLTDVNEKEFREDIEKHGVYDKESLKKLIKEKIR